MTYNKRQIFGYLSVLLLFLFVFVSTIRGKENSRHVSSDQDTEIKVSHYLAGLSLDDEGHEYLEDITPAKSSVIKNIGKIIGWIVGTVILVIIICIVCCCCCPFCLLANREERGIVLKQGPIGFLA